MSNKKPGQRPKGERSAVTIRVPADHRPYLEAAAAEAGMSLTDYGAMVLARSVDLPDPDFLQSKTTEKHNQGALPMSA